MPFEKVLGREEICTGGGVGLEMGDAGHHLHDTPGYGSEGEEFANGQFLQEVASGELGEEVAKVED